LGDLNPVGSFNTFAEDDDDFDDDEDEDEDDGDGDGDDDVMTQTSCCSPISAFCSLLCISEALTIPNVTALPSAACNYTGPTIANCTGFIINCCCAGTPSFVICGGVSVPPGPISVPLPGSVNATAFVIPTSCTC